MGGSHTPKEQAVTRLYRSPDERTTKIRSTIESQAPDILCLTENSFGPYRDVNSNVAGKGVGALLDPRFSSLVRQQRNDTYIFDPNVYGYFTAYKSNDLAVQGCTVAWRKSKFRYVALQSFPYEDKNAAFGRLRPLRSTAIA